MNKYYILTPPPNLTGLLHIGHTLNLIIQEFIKDYMLFVHNYNLESIFGFDHASLYAEIIAKRSLNIVNKLNIMNKIRSNELMFKSHILLQVQEMNIKNINNNKELFTFSNHASEIVNLYLKNLIKEKLIFFKKKVCFVDLKLRTTLSDIEVTSKLVKSNLYYIKYYLENSNDFVVIATTKPETIESDICIVFSYEDDRYEKFFNMNVINPISGKKMKILKSKYVNKEFGTGLVKVTPDFSLTDEKIFEELNLDISNFDSIYNYHDFLLNKNSLFHGNSVFEIRDLVINFLSNNNRIVKILPQMTHEFLSIRDNNPVVQIAIPQYFLDIQSVRDRSYEHIENINIIGCKGAIDIKQFTDNLKPWCISRQNLYGHLIDKDNVLDTWFSSSLYIPIAMYTLDLNIDITKFIIITAYDIMFFWIYRMFYNSQYFLKKQTLKYVIVHGILCDKYGIKISKSKENTNYVKFNNLGEFEQHKIFILSHNIFLKKILLDDTKKIYVNRFFNKIKNLLVYFNKHNFIVNKSSDIISCDILLIFFTSKLLNIFYANKIMTIDEIMSNIEYLIGSIPKFMEYITKDISLYLINIIHQDIRLDIKKNIAALINLITCFISMLIPYTYKNIADQVNYSNNYKITDFTNIIIKYKNYFKYEIIKALDLIIPIITDKKYNSEFIDVIGISGSILVSFNINKYNICFQAIDNNIKFGIYFNSFLLKNNIYSKINKVFGCLKNCCYLKCINI
ncbi:valyl-tRNA synthetase [uncultured bacterium]|nr:valyl-tRNA synthetase [uncultured bacterium]